MAFRSEDQRSIPYRIHEQEFSPNSIEMNALIEPLCRNHLDGSLRRGAWPPLEPHA